MGNQPAANPLIPIDPPGPWRAPEADLRGDPAGHPRGRPASRHPADVVAGAGRRSRRLAHHDPLGARAAAGRGLCHGPARLRDVRGPRAPRRSAAASHPDQQGAGDAPAAVAPRRGPGRDPARVAPLARAAARLPARRARGRSLPAPRLVADRPALPQVAAGRRPRLWRPGRPAGTARGHLRARGRRPRHSLRRGPGVHRRRRRAGPRPPLPPAARSRRRRLARGPRLLRVPTAPPSAPAHASTRCGSTRKGWTWPPAPGPRPPRASSS